MGRVCSMHGEIRNAYKILVSLVKEATWKIQA
jgi:hypothetical protein